MASPNSQTIDGTTLAISHAQNGALLNPKGGNVASTLYAGLFSEGSGQYYLWNTSDWTTFANKWSELAPKNYRLVSIDTDEEDPSTTWYLGAWIEMTGGYSLWRTADWNSFMTTFNNNKSSMRLLDFDIHPSSGSRYYTGTWGSTPINQTIIHDLSWDDFNVQWKALSNQGMRLNKVQVFPTATTWHLTGLFEQGSGGYALLMNADWAAFYKFYQDNQAKMQLVDFHVYDDNATRWYIGVWQETSNKHQFIFGQDWGSFVNQWTELAGQGLRLKKTVRYPNLVEVPLPKWDQVFENKLGTTAMGYAYSVMHNGQVVGQGVNKARAAQDSPLTTWTVDTRINLASVSKSITAVAVMKLLTDYHLSVDDAFYPLVKSQFPSVGKGVDKVTIRNLLEMKSGMVPDGTLNPDSIWTFLATYLKAQNIPDGAPGSVPAHYSNTNYTILQAIIDTVTGHGGQTPDYYVTYVAQTVFKPMGIDPAIFSNTPDPQSSGALSYSSSSDSNHGMHWGPLSCVAAGGWVSSAKELAKFLACVRTNAVLSPDATRLMLDGQLGWYAYDGVFGRYFHHNGGLLNGATPAQGLVTGIIRLADGYDALLLVNSWGPDTIGLMIEAFETRSV